MRGLIICISILLFNACSSSKGYLTAGTESLILQHQRIAILPFKVIFSDDYKAISRGGQRQGNWQEQERVAGLDLQKTCFLNLAKHASKKKWGFTVQDFLTTNKTLEREGIRFSQLTEIDKGVLARKLGVDAVIWGSSNMEVNMRSFASRNGINSHMSLYDAESGSLVWKNSVFENANRQFDSPQYLAETSINQLVRSLPYKAARN